MIHIKEYLDPPKTTAQQARLVVRNGKLFKYDTPALLKAKLQLKRVLKKYVPKTPLDKALSLEIVWSRLGSARDQERQKEEDVFDVRRPDCDNILKGLLDIMTDLGFWVDDSLLTSIKITKLKAKSKPYLSILINEV